MWQCGGAPCDVVYEVQVYETTMDGDVVVNKITSKFTSCVNAVSGEVVVTPTKEAEGASGITITLSAVLKVSDVHNVSARTEGTSFELYSITNVVTRQRGAFNFSRDAGTCGISGFSRVAGFQDAVATAAIAARNITVRRPVYTLSELSNVVSLNRVDLDEQLRVPGFGYHELNDCTVAELFSEDMNENQTVVADEWPLAVSFNVQVKDATVADGNHASPALKMVFQANASCTPLAAANESAFKAGLIAALNSDSGNSADLDEDDVDINITVVTHADLRDRLEVNVVFVVPDAVNMIAMNKSTARLLGSAFTVTVGDAVCVCEEAAFTPAADANYNTSAAFIQQDTLWNAGTGLTTINFARTGKFNITWTAETVVASETIPLVVATLIVDIRLADFTDQACSDGTAREFGLAQDDLYTCECTPGAGLLLREGGCNSTTGEICENCYHWSQASSNPKEPVDGFVIGFSTAGGLVFMMSCVIGWLRYQNYLTKHRPADIGTMQEDILNEFGLGTTKDIGKHEFGMNITFEKDQTLVDFLKQSHVASLRTEDRSNSSLQGSSGGAWGSFQRELRDVIVKVCPRLAPDVAKARITVASAEPDTRCKVLVVIPRPQSSKYDISASAVGMMSKKAHKKDGLSINMYRIDDVCLACPTVIPREIARKCLTRLEPLGEGQFGEVHKYSVDEKGRGTPAYFVAVKTIKAKDKKRKKKDDGGGPADTGRADLLREAALMALFDHRNVLALVGICTVPRDVPALMLMAFCEGGTLEDLLRAPLTGSMSTARRLTFCAQVCQGLGYIAARHIVHRDVAARNVLLDSTNVCKVADYGMALSFNADSGKEYVRVGDELAVRWASIEVLKDQKFSVQSDVWAFGAMAWEVFSGGREPYSDQFDSLTEITNYIKEGGQLTRPDDDTPIEIFHELMLPCYHPDPGQRPSFADLYRVACKHGAAEDDEAMAEVAIKRAEQSTTRRHVKEDALARGDRSLLGPSIHHLTTALYPGMVAAVTPKWFRNDVTRQEAEGLLNAAAVEGGFVVENKIPVDHVRWLTHF